MRRLLEGDVAECECTVAQYALLDRVGDGSGVGGLLLLVEVDDPLIVALRLVPLLARLASLSATIEALDVLRREGQCLSGGSARG